MSFHKTSKIARIILLTLFLSECVSVLRASPGDTTWVTVFNGMKLTHHGNYDTTVAFPTGKRYRKIRMHYILGRYACPPGSQYCGSWDYTTQVFSLPKGKDTVEIARVITPYATDWLQKNKSHDYIVEVTDYASVLEDSTHMRFRYDGYSWGFTLTLKMEFIEGIPPMDALSVKNIYNGYFAYGNAANPIENHLSAKTLSYSSPNAFIKNSVSGHGADNTGCSEFCSKYYRLYVDNNQVAQHQIWRDDCGFNQVYPQTGTWVFDRSNWCPGAVVWPIYHDLAGFTGSVTTFTANIDMEPYVNSNPSGGYNFVSQLLSYSNYNHAEDISIEDIISPSYDNNYFRDNPACSNPVIKVRNTGTDPLFTVAFEYGISGRTLSTYTWTGYLNPSETMNVVLPPSTAIMAHSVAAQFEVRVTGVNGSPGDDYADNNYYYSKTKPVTIVPKDFVVKLATNGSSTGQGYNETTWQLFDENDQLVAQRLNGASNSYYQDTVSNLADGCYRLVVSDAGCDGFQWWFYSNYNPDPGYGALRMDKLNGSTIFIFTGDIGCGYTKYFHVGAYPPPPALPDLAGLAREEQAAFTEVYPNPAQGSAILKLNLSQSANTGYRLLDVNGKILRAHKLGMVDLRYERIDLTGLGSGIYFVEVTVDGQAPRVLKLAIH